MQVSYQWLQRYFEEPLPNVEELVELLNTHAFEVEGTEVVGDDVVIDVDVLPNRAHDCLCHRGIAKELGSILGRDLDTDPLRDELPEYTDGGIVVRVDEGIPNTRTLGLRINGVKVGPSPDWLRERLETLGQRSINNVVDATNYVMLDMGQPLHAFDAKMFESGTLRIKRAEEGEEITLLGDIPVTLSAEDVVVSDGEKALDVAGIRGGSEAEVGEDTTDIVVSVSHFDPVMVRKTAQRLKLWTDAAKRNQNNPSPYLMEHGLREVTELILDLAGGEVIGVSRAGAPVPDVHSVSVSLEQVNGLLGFSFSLSEVTDIISRMGMRYQTEGEVVTVEIAPERMDLTIPEDVIEEIGRLYGYDKLPDILLPDAQKPEVQNAFWVHEVIRSVLMEAGYSEVYTYSLRDGGSVKLVNALNTEKNHLRVDLASGLEEALELNKVNAPLFGVEHIDVFEIGNVFPSQEEEVSMLGIATTRKKKEKIFTELEAKLSEALGVSVAGSLKGNVYEILLTDIIAGVDPARLPEYEPHTEEFVVPSQYPFMLRDVAVWTPEGTTDGEVEALIRGAAGDLLYRIDCFDEFSKDGRTSFAYHLVFQSSERTLSDEEVNEIMEKVYGKLGEQKGFEIR